MGHDFRFHVWVARSLCQSCNLNRLAHFSESDNGRLDERTCLVQQMERGNVDFCFRISHMVLASLRMVSSHANHNLAVLGCTRLYRCAPGPQMDSQFDNYAKPSNITNCHMVHCLDCSNRRRRSDRQQHCRLGVELGGARALSLLGTTDDLLCNCGFVKLCPRSNYRFSGITGFEES